MQELNSALTTLPAKWAILACYQSKICFWIQHRISCQLDAKPLDVLYCKCVWYVIHVCNLRYCHCLVSWYINRLDFSFREMHIWHSSKGCKVILWAQEVRQVSHLIKKPCDHSAEVKTIIRIWDMSFLSAVDICTIILQCTPSAVPDFFLEKMLWKLYVNNYDLSAL